MKRIALALVLLSACSAHVDVPAAISNDAATVEKADASPSTVDGEDASVDAASDAIVVVDAGVEAATTPYDAGVPDTYVPPQQDAALPPHDAAPPPPPHDAGPATYCSVTGFPSIQCPAPSGTSMVWQDTRAGMYSNGICTDAGWVDVATGLARNCPVGALCMAQAGNMGWRGICNLVGQ